MLGALLFDAGDLEGARRELRLAARFARQPELAAEVRRRLAVLNDPGAGR